MKFTTMICEVSILGKFVNADGVRMVLVFHVLQHLSVRFT